MINTISAFFSSIGTGEIVFLVECAIVLVLAVVLIQIAIARSRAAENANKQQTEPAVPAAPALERRPVESVQEQVRPILVIDAIPALPVHEFTAEEKPVPDDNVEPMFAPVRNPGPEGIPEVTVQLSDESSSIGLDPLVGMEVHEAVAVELEDVEDAEKLAVFKAKMNSFTDIQKKSFLDKFGGAEQHVKDTYAEIKNELLSYKKVKSKISNSCDTFRYGKKRLCKIKVTGKNLMVFLALDPNAPEFNDGTMPHIDMSDKKAFAETPFKIKVHSPLSVKRTLKAIEAMAKKEGLQKNPDYEEKNFAENPSATIIPA